MASAVLRAARACLWRPAIGRCWQSTSSSYLDYDSLKSEIEKQMTPREYFNFAQDIVAPWAQKKPSHPALYFTDGHKDTTISYSELLLQAKTLATALSDPQPPKCALVLLPKMPAWWVANVAASWCGTVVSCGTTMLTPRDVAHRLSECGADCIMCTPELAASLDDVSRAVPLRISVSEDQQSARYWLDLTEDDVVWNISDTGWAKAAWTSLYTPLMAGATAFVHQMKQFDPEEMLLTLCKQPVTVLCAPPTAYRALVQHQLSKYPFKALRHCVSAGEPLNPEVVHEWTNGTGLQIYEGIGQSETTLLCGVCKGMKVRPGSMGKPGPGYNLKVLNEQLEELPAHHEGQLAVSLKHGHPLGLFKGYQGDAQRTAQAFRDDYYLTGDRVYYDEDGYFWFVGRADDIIISSGYRIGPFEVESCLLEHPAVAESAVVSSPDALRGEVVKAFVVLTEEYKHHETNTLTTDLQDHVKRMTAPYKYPRKIEFVDALPKTISGKIRRVELRNKEWDKSKS